MGEVKRGPDFTFSDNQGRHYCERKRSNPYRHAKKEWIASSQTLLAMTAFQICIRDLSRARCARVMQEIVRASDEEGAGNAGCPMHPLPRVQM